MVTNSGDPRGNLGFVQEEEEEMAVGEDYSDDSDSDDDIERYVFLARQPALVDSQAQAEDDASSDDDDDDDDAMPDGEAAGGRGGKRLLLREIFDASPSRKKARVDLAPLAQAGPSGSETSSSPFGARGHVMVGVPEQEGEAKNKKCGKRRSPDSEAGEKSHRALTAAAAAAKTAAVDSGASRRFHCNICGRCFGSHQALGGHVLGHKKKAKNAIVVAASHEDVAGGNGYYNQKMDVVAVGQEVANGNGNSNSNKNAVIAASHEHTNGNGDDEENAITLSSYGYANGNSNSDEEMTIVAANQNDHNADGAAKEKKVLAAASRNEADGNGDAKEKVVVGRCHKGASNGNNSVRKTQHKCDVCGKECLSGQALGGHMRKHRERPAGEGRSARPASASDSQPPTVRPISAEICLQRAVVITGEQPGQ